REGAWGGRPVSRRVESGHAVAAGRQRLHERGELAAVPGPAVHEVNRRPAAPGLADDLVACDVHGEPLTGSQLRGARSGLWPAAGQGEPDPLGPPGPQPRSCVFEQSERAADRGWCSKETNDRAFLFAWRSDNRHRGTLLLSWTLGCGPRRAAPRQRDGLAAPPAGRPATERHGGRPASRRTGLARTGPHRRRPRTAPRQRRSGTLW